MISEHSRSLVGFFLLFSTLFLAISRIIILRGIYKLIRGYKILKRRIIVIGAGNVGRELIRKIKQNPFENIEIVGFFDDDLGKKGTNILGIQVLGTTADIEFYLKKLKIDIDGIYICINFDDYDNFNKLIDKCKAFGFPIYLDSKDFKVIYEKVNIQEFESLFSPTLYGNSKFIYVNFLKRVIDITSSIVLITILSPIAVIISIMVKFSSKGPILYKCRVIGKNEKEFTWYKFRTMKINHDSSVHQKFMNEIIINKKKQGILKLNHDYRITKIGKFLRKFSLDELPQLINVLKGEMSLIGPRPCLPFEYDLYENWYKKRFSVTPGISGLWQAFGRSSVSYDDMIIMDLYYIENISFWLDLKILLKTIPTVLFGKGAY